MTLGSLGRLSAVYPHSTPPPQGPSQQAPRSYPAIGLPRRPSSLRSHNPFSHPSPSRPPSFSNPSPPRQSSFLRSRNPFIPPLPQQSSPLRFHFPNEASAPPVPSTFHPLIRVLEKFRAQGLYAPLWSAVGGELRQDDPHIYDKLGGEIKRFKEYAEAAERNGLVALFLGAPRKPGKEKISLIWPS